jgi:hypothetical protein
MDKNLVDKGVAGLFFIVGLLLIFSAVLSGCSNNASDTSGEAISAASSANGKIYADSNPRGASVYLDNNIYKGVSPVTITTTVGSHKLTYKKSGYSDFTTTLTVSKDKTTFYTANLTPVQNNTNSTNSTVCGNKIINTGEDCDGTNLNGKSCISLGYAGGTLKCSSACRFDTSSCTINNQTNSTGNYSGNYTGNQTGNTTNSSSKYGQIYASSTPSAASVYVDNAYKGLSPLTVYNVAVGNHSVLFKKLDYYDVTKYAVVYAGTTTNVYANMTVIPSSNHTKTNSTNQTILAS